MPTCTPQTSSFPFFPSYILNLQHLRDMLVFLFFMPNATRVNAFSTGPQYLPYMSTNVDSSSR